MAAHLPGPRLAGKLQVRVAPMVDLNFSFFVVRTPGTEASCGWLRSLIEIEPDIRQRAREFWPGDSEFCFDELLVIAQAMGDLFTPNPEEFLRKLAAGVPPIRVPELPSEDTGAQERIQQRIDQLRSNDARRQAYVELTGRVWAHLRPVWEAGGRAAAEALAVDLRRRVESASNLAEVIPASHLALLERHRGHVTAAVERGEAVLVPLTLNPGGTYLFSFPGLLVMSYGPEAPRQAAARREQSAQAASRFKVLSDPTRLALVNCMLRGPMSVTDLAVSFELAQPTVSAHVKILRDANLLDSERSGTFTLYRVREGHLRAFVEEALSELTRAN